jgi:membrane protein implicated in regulation of membrane protease activity
MIFAWGIVTGVLSSVQFLVFLALAIGGLMMLGFSAIFGGHHDGEIGGHEAGHGGDGHDHDAAPSFLSPRVFFAFLTGFGVAGAIATVYGAPAAWATGIGFIPGMVMAFLAWFTAHYLFTQQANSSLRPGQVVGASGTVVTAIPLKGMGEVNVSVNGQILSYTALLSEDQTSDLPAGARIKVTQDLGDKVVVKKAVAAA